MHKATFTEAILEATDFAMNRDSRVHLIGLGAAYSNGLDGTAPPSNRYPGRILDIPVSEAAVTGLAVGAAAAGLRPIIHHGRVEFSMYALDAILTQAAKWNYMFGGGYPCPLVIRIATGRQWGNGPQHTFVPRSMFSVPGLKVVVPSTPEAAKGLLLAAIDDPNPVVFLEPRWLYKLRCNIPGGSPDPAWSLAEAHVLVPGSDVTIVAVGDMVIEALKAATRLKSIDISAEVIDLISIYPLDMETIRKSVRRTGRLIVADTSTSGSGISAEIVAGCAGLLKRKSQIVECPSCPCPTSTAFTAGYYPGAAAILDAFAVITGKRLTSDSLTFDELNLPPRYDVDELIQSCLGETMTCR